MAVIHSFSVPLSVAGGASRIAFTGSRAPSGASLSVCSQVAGLLWAHMPVGARVGVGCCSGIDQAVRHQVPGVVLFSVARPVVHRGAFVVRSIRLVRWLCRGAGAVLFAFPSHGCPSGVVAGSSWAGCGSGTWGTVALALGSGARVVVFVPRGAVGSSAGLAAFVGPLWGRCVLVHHSFHGYWVFLS